MPFTSSWKKKLIRRVSCQSWPSHAFRRGPTRKRRPAAELPLVGSADHELGISLYLPDESILNRKNMPTFRSPCESKEVGCTRMHGGTPDLQNDAIASSITCVAAYTGGPNVPKFPNFCRAALAITASAGIAVMSGPNEDTYEPLIVNVPGENRPSVPKITAFLCCWARFRPNCWAFAATCQGRTTTEVSGVTLATNEEKSVTFCDTDSWSSLIPAAWKTGVIALTRPVE